MWQKSQTVAYIKTLKGTDLQSQQRKKKRCRTERKMLKIAKKTDLWAKRELRFTAGSQGHAAYPTQKIQLQLIDALMHRHTHTHKTHLNRKDHFEIHPLICIFFVYLSSFVFILSVSPSVSGGRTQQTSPGVTFSGGALSKLLAFFFFFFFLTTETN